MTTDDQNDKLYAGKFKTVEELEVGYKNSLPVFQENENLKKKVDEATKVPDDYNTPADVALHDSDIAEAKRLAKESGMTQGQYERFARQQHAKSAKQSEDFENAKKEIGADNLNILQDYVNNTYPEKLRPSILKNLIKDKDARGAAMEHRTQLLNNTVPGMNKTSRPFDHRVTYNDILKAREEHQARKGDAKLKKRYLDLTAAYAHQKDN